MAVRLIASESLSVMVLALRLPEASSAKCRCSRRALAESGSYKLRRHVSSVLLNLVLVKLYNKFARAEITQCNFDQMRRCAPSSGSQGLANDSVRFKGTIKVLHSKGKFYYSMTEEVHS